MIYSIVAGRNAVARDGYDNREDGGTENGGWRGECYHESDGSNLKDGKSGGMAGERLPS